MSSTSINIEYHVMVGHKVEGPPGKSMLGLPGSEGRKNRILLKVEKAAWYMLRYCWEEERIRCGLGQVFESGICHVRPSNYSFYLHWTDKCTELEHVANRLEATIQGSAAEEMALGPII
jgi:hypothetical protein